MQMVSGALSSLGFRAPQQMLRLILLLPCYRPQHLSEASQIKPCHAEAPLEEESFLESKAWNRMIKYAAPQNGQRVLVFFCWWVGVAGRRLGLGD